MRQSFFSFMSAVAITAVLSGCATMIDRTTQWVEVYTPGVEQVDCNLDTPEQRYRLLTPNKVRVERARFDIVVRCEKSGYESVTRILPATLTPSLFLNVFNGIVPGTAYDMAAESMYRYPAQVEIEMVPLAPKNVVFEAIDEAPALPVPDPLPSAFQLETPAEPDPAYDPSYNAGAADRAFDAGRK